MARDLGKPPIRARPIPHRYLGLASSYLYGEPMLSSPASLTPWPSMIRVAVADDRTLFREALLCLLSARDSVEVVGSGATADAAALLAEHQPDVLLIGSPDGAIATTREVAGIMAGARILVIGAREDHQARVLAAGATGYVHSETRPDELVAAIAAVHAGERVPTERDASVDPVEILSPRELETLRFLAEGQTNREIALQLGISVKTVDTHRGHVLKKLRLRNNSDLTRFAIQHGLVELGA